MVDHRLHADEPPRRPGQSQEGGQGGGHGDEAQGGVPLLAAQQGGDVQPLTHQVGEGVPAVHDLGGEHRQDLHLVVLADVFFLLRRQLLGGEVPDPLLAQKAGDLPVEVVLDLDEAGDDPVDLVQLPRGGEAGLVVDLIGGDQGQVEQAPHPDHEELVQVAGEDGDELQALQQGDGVVPRLLQHPAVEAQPAELPTLGVAVLAHVDIRTFCHSDPSRAVGGAAAFLPVYHPAAGLLSKMLVK